MRFADLDGVTLDAYGTLVHLRDPIANLVALTGRERGSVEAAFEAEKSYYVEHSLEGRDQVSLAGLHARCTDVFNAALSARLSPEEYVGALEYEVLAAVPESLASLRRRGLALAVVANWDCDLPRQLERLGLARFFSAVVTSADVGTGKPAPRIFEAALAALGVTPNRALHIGDGEVDERGAAAAGMRFARAPVPEALAALA